MKNRIISVFLVVFGLLNGLAQELYDIPDGKATRWASFENAKAEKGGGGKENKGAKGHPFERIPAGKSLDLLDIDGSGTIKRIWLTISDRSPEMLRALTIKMFWEGSDKPAVAVPLGDFFGLGLGQKTAFENKLFSDPEGRSFNCFVPMPFQKSARITITNESDKDLDAIFYDINLLKENHEGELFYFHAYWNREKNTTLGEAFKILPKINGKGRFIGTNMGIVTNKLYKDTWWGEGEVKIYIDGDSNFPSLVGSGTEDYVGTAYGQGTYNHMFQGSLLADKEEGAFAFYRYHIPDPVYFYGDIKVTIQQMGGAPRDVVRKLVENGADLIPVTIDHAPNFTKLFELENAPKLEDKDFPDGWTNFYRSDDVSATAYFYLNKPYSDLPPLQTVELRTANLIKAAVVKNDL